MRDPNIKQVEEIREKYSVLEINHIPEYSYESYDLLDQKDFTRYIKDVERICRNSFEYRMNDECCRPALTTIVYLSSI